jgi:hypothetical protein
MTSYRVGETPAQRAERIRAEGQRVSEQTRRQRDEQRLADLERQVAQLAAGKPAEPQPEPERAHRTEFVVDPSGAWHELPD